MALDTILISENSHLKQWPRHLFSIALTLLSLIVTFLRGSKKFDSIVGIEKCGVVDWTLVVSLLVVMFIFSYIGVRINKKE